MNGSSSLDQCSGDIGGLAGLSGLKTVREQLAARIAVQAEQARRAAGVEVRRPAWKNLVFTGGPGTGKSRAAAAVARDYRDLGLLPLGHVAEVAAADLADKKPWAEAARLVDEAAGRIRGGVVMITEAHGWYDLPDHGRQMLRCLYQLLNQVRDRHREDLAVILTGQAHPLGELLRTSPALATCFPAVINFPGYTADELAAIFAALAEEADSHSLRMPHVRPPPYSDRPKAVTDQVTPDWPFDCSIRPPPARLAGSWPC